MMKSGEVQKSVFVLSLLTAVCKTWRLCHGLGLYFSQWCWRFVETDGIMNPEICQTFIHIFRLKNRAAPMTPNPLKMQWKCTWIEKKGKQKHSRTPSVIDCLPEPGPPLLKQCGIILRTEQKAADIQRAECQWSLESYSLWVLKLQGSCLKELWCCGELIWSNEQLDFCLILFFNGC